MRNIQSVNVNVSKWSTTVYINFDNGRFGTHTKDAGAENWIDSGVSADELAQAKLVALKNHKWSNWRAPRKEEVTHQPNSANRVGDEDELNYQYPQATQYGDDSEKVLF